MTLNFLTAGDAGDLILSLPTIKALGGGTLFVTDNPATRLRMTPARMEVIAALVRTQPYIRDMAWHEKEAIDFSFVNFREHHTPTQSLGESQRLAVAPFADVDWTKPWLTVKRGKKSTQPVFARSPRYRNPTWDPVWRFYVDQFPKADFVGHESEAEDFRKEFPEWTGTWRQTDNFLELAEVIANAPLFVGNQSAPFAIAEGLKVRRILEVCPLAPDCIYPGNNVLHLWDGGGRSAAATGAGASHWDTTVANYFNNCSILVLGPRDENTVKRMTTRGITVLTAGRSLEVPAAHADIVVAFGAPPEPDLWRIARRNVVLSGSGPCTVPWPVEFCWVPGKETKEPEIRSTQGEWLAVFRRP